MKNLLKKLAIIFGALFVVFIAFCIYIQDFPFVGEGKISGQSMAPTLNDGERIWLNIYSEPQIGDIISFRCFTEKCHGGRASESDFVIKRIIKIENGNYWIEGDNKEHSWDSRNFGWLSTKDMHIEGIVIQ